MHSAVFWAYGDGADFGARAYVITPVDGNAITLSWSFFDGGLNLNGTIPLQAPRAPIMCQPSVTIMRSGCSGARQTLPVFCPTAWARFRDQSLALTNKFIAPAFSTLGCASL